MQVGINDDFQEVCQLSGCTNIDPLSTRCTNCGMLFCGEHISGRAHECTAMKDAIALTCPLCDRFVPKEFPSQSPDEAVSRHMDRGCRDVPQTAGSAAAEAASPWPERSSAGAGRRLGGGAKESRQPWCAVAGCSSVHFKDKQVVCDRCGRRFCIEHRGPASHNCKGAAITAQERGAPAGKPASPPPAAAAATGPVSFAELLARPANTARSAVGKPTELPADMVVPLVCFAVPVEGAAAPPGGAEPPLLVSPVAPFFMHVPKSFVVGKMLDQAVGEAVRAHPRLRAKLERPWHVHMLALPIPAEAAANPAMYPAIPLATYVRNTPLATTKRALVVISPYQQLPRAMVGTAGEMRVRGKDDDDKCAMM